MSVLYTRGSHGRSFAETRSRGGGACGGRGGGLGRGGAGACDLGECSERSDLESGKRKTKRRVPFVASFAPIVAMPFAPSILVPSSKARSP